MKKLLLFTCLCYGGSLNDYAYCIELTSDGGYIVAEFTSSNNGDVTSNHYRCTGVLDNKAN